MGPFLPPFSELRCIADPLLDGIPQCLEAATTVPSLSLLCPSPDLRFLALRTARRHPQCRARRSGDRTQWQECGRVTTAFVVTPRSCVRSNGTSSVQHCRRALQFPRYGGLPGNLLAPVTALHVHCTVEYQRSSLASVGGRVCRPSDCTETLFVFLILLFIDGTASVPQAF